MRTLAGGLLALLLVACASGPAPLPTVADPAQPFALLPAASLGESLSAQQHLSGEARTRRFSGLVQLEIRPDHLAMAAVTATGQRLFELRLDEHGLDSEAAAWLPEDLQAERVLREFQLVFWPLSALQAALQPGWQIDEPTDGPSRRRQLRHNGALMIDIRYEAADAWSAPVHLDNPQDGYRYSIRSLHIDRH